MENNQGQMVPYGPKRVLVKFHAGTRPPQEVLVSQETTTRDLLNALTLAPEHFVIYRDSLDTTFGVEEELYPQMIDGDLVFASTKVDAGEV